MLFRSHNATYDMLLFGISYKGLLIDVTRRQLKKASLQGAAACMELNLRGSLGRNRYGKANSYDVGVGMFASAQGSKHCDRLPRSDFEGDSPAQTYCEST